VYQMVRNADIAHHAGNFSYNETSIGIEHVRKAGSAQRVTEMQYRASAALVRWLSTQYDVQLVLPIDIAPANPASGSGIIPHRSVPDPTNPLVGGGLGHSTCPTKFNFDYYQELLADGSGQASATTVYPSPCVGDVNGDSVTNGFDVSVCLSNFNRDISPESESDINGDGRVNAADLSLLLANFGNRCN